WFLWGWKLFASLYWFSMFVANLATLQDIHRYWIFLTNWGVGACVFSYIKYIINNHDIISISDVPLQWFHKFLWILQIVATDASLIITILYWALLTPNFSVFSINNHAINFVIMFIDFFIVAIPTRLLHFIYVSLFALVYIVFSLILHGSGYESAIYPVLNWSTNPGISAGISVGAVIVAPPIVHGLYWCVFQLRTFLGKKANPSQSRTTMASHPLGIS
uniref:Uncharacterized protein n=1 Tax=Ciona savignyi TaxID=51511 RepID=H2ZLY3_CIOSA